MVPERGLEPPWGEPHSVLNAARIPVPPLRQIMHFSVVGIRSPQSLIDRI